MTDLVIMFDLIGINSRMFQTSKLTRNYMNYQIKVFVELQSNNPLENVFVMFPTNIYY